MHATAVDDYLAALPAPRAAALAALRREVHQIIPDVEECIRYGMPAFKYRGKAVLYIGAAKAHLAVYENHARLAPEFADALKGYPTSKGSVQFQPDRPLPAGFVAAMVKARIREIDGTFTPGE